MAIEALLSHLEREADAEATRLLAGADAEAAAIEQRARDEANRRRTQATDRLEREDDAAIRDRLVSARRDQRLRLLSARAAAIDRIFAAADQALRSTPVERYRHRLAELTDQALSYVEGTPATVVCAEAAVASIAGPLANRPGVRIMATAGAVPGVLVRADDGTVVVDNTLTEQLSRRRAELAIPLAARLTGDADALG